MIKALVHQLGLDKLGNVLAEEVRHAQVEVLQEERTLLARLLAQLDNRIRGLGGRRRHRPPGRARTTTKNVAARKPQRKARITPRPGGMLKGFVLKVLAKSRGPVDVTLVDRVLAAGHETTAKHSTLVTSTHTALTDRKLFRRVVRGSSGFCVPRGDRGVHDEAAEHFLRDEGFAHCGADEAGAARAVQDQVGVD